MAIETKEGFFKDSVQSVIDRQGITFSKSIYILLYYIIGIYLPSPPLPLGKWGMKIREWLTRNIFKKCTGNFKVHKGVNFGSGINIEIGNNSSLNRDVWIGNDTVIGDDVMMGPEVIILSGSHNFDNISIPMTKQGAPDRSPVVVGDDVWIGTRSIILPGIKIGSHSIIGAGSIVTKNVPEWAIVAGNPAKIIRYRK